MRKGIFINRCLLLTICYLLFTTSCWAVTKPTNLKCNGKTKPFYIDSPEPTFSWTASTQVAYKILVSTSSDFGILKWEPEIITSSVKSCVYAGNPLSGDTTYYWKVKVSSASGEYSEYAGTATFRMNFFLKGETIPSGTIKTIASGDLNGDGLADLVLGTDNDGIRFYKNNGDKPATFSPQGSAQEGKFIDGLAIRDLDNDGISDVISACNGATLIASEIFLNDGNFEFHIGDTLSLLKTCNSVAVFDMNNDGNCDIIEGIYGEKNAFYKGSGNGTFLTGVQFEDESHTDSVAVADFNNDGNFDFVAMNRWWSGDLPTEKVIVYKGNGVGGFETMPWDSGMDYFYAVAVGDINNDGNCDFIAATKAIGPEQGEDTCIGIYTGDGNFGFTRTAEIGGPRSFATSLALADLNNDGYLDLIVGWKTTGDECTRVYLNDQSGNFLLLDKDEEGSGANALAIADFDGDGDLDYVSATDNGCEFFYSTLADDGHSNNSPDHPSDGSLTAEWKSNSTKLHLTWGPGSDAETTDEDALQYNLLLKSAAGIVVSTAGGSIFNEGAGFYGNMMYSSWTILNIDRKTYFFSVQTIDGQGAGSSFSQEKIINEKSYPGWDVEDIILSTCCRQYNREEVEASPELDGCVKTNFKIKDYEKDMCALTTFYYSLDGGDSWVHIPDQDSVLPDFHSPLVYNFISSTTFENVVSQSFNWDTRETIQGNVNSTHTIRARVKFKAYDGYEVSTFCVSGEFEIDNKKPSAPGGLSPSGKYTGASITLLYGTTSFDENFDEYVIYYGLSDAVDKDNNTGSWSSANDTNLSSATFFGASSTTVTGLNEDTTYYFRIYAYDSFANYDFSDVSPPVKTNDIPALSFVSVSQRSDGSGLVDFSFKGFDCDKDTWTYVSAKVRNPAYEYVDTVPANYDASFSTPLIFSASGVVNNYVFSATSTFGSPVCYSSVFLKLKVTDGIDSSNEVNNTSGFKIDTKPPEGITRFKVGDRFSSNIQLQWNLNPSEDFDEDNFKEYVVWYGTSPGVIAGSPYYEWNSSSQPSLGDKNTRTARVEGLTPGIEYFLRLYVHDDYGNFYKTSEVSEFTRGGPDSWFNSAEQEPTGDGAVSLSVVCLNPDGYDSFLNVCFSTISNSGPWSKITLSATVYAYLGGAPVDPPPEIINSQTYQVGTEENPIPTTVDSTTTLTLVWNSREDIPDAYHSSVYLKASVKDIEDVVQSSPAVSGPFTLDNIDPTLDSCIYDYVMSPYL